VIFFLIVTSFLAVSAIFLASVVHWEIEELRKDIRDLKDLS
jgi:hypothetical protein